MKKQIPHGPDDLNCHRCLPEAVPMSLVCHKCSLWTAMLGKDPQTGEELNEWRCADSWLLTGILETARMARSGAAATESFRNEMVTAQIERLQQYSRLALPK